MEKILNGQFNSEDLETICTDLESDLEVDLKKTGGEYNRNILHVLLEAPDHKKCKKEIFERCLHAILDCGEKRLGDIVNHKDALGFVPLHYATNYWNDHDEIIKKILLNGGMASIGIESELNPKFKDSEGSQLWKLHDNMLQNKVGLWMSDEDEKWNFQTKDDLVYIENVSKQRVLGTTSDGKVISEDIEEGKIEQLWKKGEPNAEGYFTLENYKVPMVLTAISSKILEIKDQFLIPLGEKPINSINTEVLEGFLDDCLNTNEEPMNGRKLKLLFKFPLLIPHSGSQPNQKPNPNKIYEDENSTDQVGIPMDPNSSNEEKDSTSRLLEEITETKSLRETEVIWHIGESYEHRSLLLHPVIDTFVELKWKMALNLYIRRIRFFWLFAVILTSEIFNQYEKKATTCDGGCILKKILFILLPMLFLIGNVFYQFLKHKVTWERFERYLFDWSLILICLAYTVVAFVIPVFGLQNSHTSEIGMHILINVWFMNLARFIANSFGGKFAWQGHWIMEILMMISVALKLIFKVISDKWYPYPESNPNQIFESIFAAFALTVSWSVFATEFATISTTINIYVEMFYKILTTMVVTAGGGLFLILSFAAGFNIIWNQSESQDKNHFNSTMNSIAKTMAMFVGELDYNAMQGHTANHNNKDETFWSDRLYQLYLLAFIFVVMIVYNNFLNGLAVADVAMLRKESEELSLVQRLDIILTYESLSQQGLNIEKKFKEIMHRKLLWIYYVLCHFFLPLHVPRKFALLPENCKEMEFSFKKNTTPQRFHIDFEMKKEFTYTDSKGEHAEFELEKSRFKNIENLISSKKKKEGLKDRIAAILSDKEKDNAVKLSEILSAMDK